MLLFSVGAIFEFKLSYVLDVPDVAFISFMASFTSTMLLVQSYISTSKCSSNAIYSSLTSLI